MTPSVDLMKAIGRLNSNDDFQKFTAWLQALSEDALSNLLRSSQTSSVHQLQGETKVLMDILRSIRSAQPSLPHIG